MVNNEPNFATHEAKLAYKDGYDAGYKEARDEWRAIGKRSGYSEALEKHTIYGVVLVALLVSLPFASYRLGVHSGTNARVKAEDTEPQLSDIREEGADIASIPPAYSDYEKESGEEIVIEYFTNLSRGDHRAAYNLRDAYWEKSYPDGITSFIDSMQNIQRIENLRVTYQGLYTHPGYSEPYLLYEASMKTLWKDTLQDDVYWVTVRHWGDGLAIHLLDKPGNF